MALPMGQLTVQEFVEGESGPLLTYGLQCVEACHYHVESTLKLSRVYLLLSKSLTRESNIIDRFRLRFSDKIMGIRVGMKPHTLWSEVLDVVNEARTLNIEVIITVGAGSLTDAAKLIAWALANDVRTTEDLAQLAHQNSPQNANMMPPSVKHIAVPSTLSGGEYTSFAGATNDKTMAKTLFKPPGLNPVIVVLDPEIAATTPSRLFLGTGIRAVDHCVETLCSLQSNKKGDHAAREGLKLLIPALLAYQKDPSNSKAIMQAFLGVAESVKTSHFGVEKGASHAIGHQLGPLGVPHGETSCILLPAVCKYNALKMANVHRQQEVARYLLRLTQIQNLLEGQSADLADILTILIRTLELPRSLKDVGIGRDAFNTLAENTLSDMWAKTNPVPLVKKEDVLEILEIVAE